MNTIYKHRGKIISRSYKEITILTIAYTNDIDKTMKQKRVDVPSVNGDSIMGRVEKCWACSTLNSVFQHCYAITTSINNGSR